MSQIAPEHPRRIDATRNIARIREAAIAVLAEDPGACMNDVAERAGVGRATLYRHFPSRDDLLAALKAQARAEAVAAVEACPLDEGSAVESIERIVRVMIDLGDRYRFLHRDWTATTKDERATRERISATFRAAIERGQRRGELSRAVPAEWGAIALRGLTLAALDELGEGRLSQSDAEKLVSRIVLQGLGK